MSKTYFVRVRGRVTGPHALADLQRMLRLGTLSRIHSISNDQETWRPAQDWEELFPTPPESHELAPLSGAPEMPSAGQGAVGDEAESLSIPLSPPDSEHERVHPDLNKPGVLDAGNAPPPVPGAANMPRTPTMRHEPLTMSPELQRDPSWLDKFSLAEGICVGIVLIICVNMPHTKNSEGLIWWWNMASIPGGVLLQVFCLFAIAAGVGLLLISLLAQGSARSMAYLITGAAGICVVAVALLRQPSGPALATAALPAALLLPLMSISLFRRSSQPDETRGRMIQTVLSAFLCATAVAGAILVTIRLGGQPYSGQPYNGSIPAWAIFTIGLSIMGMLGSVACGVCSMIAARSPFRPKLHLGLMITGIVSMSVLALAAAVLGGGVAMGGADAGARFYLVQMLKLVVITYSLAGLLAAGLFELMTGRVGPSALAGQAAEHTKEQLE